MCPAFAHAKLERVFPLSGVGVLVYPKLFLYQGRSVEVWAQAAGDTVLIAGAAFVFSVAPANINHNTAILCTNLFPSVENPGEVLVFFMNAHVWVRNAENENARFAVVNCAVGTATCEVVNLTSRADISRRVYDVVPAGAVGFSALGAGQWSKTQSARRWQEPGLRKTRKLLYIKLSGSC